MNDKKNTRRDFIEKASYCLAGSLLAGSIPGLTSCEKSMYKGYEIDVDACVGCTDCLYACYYGAVWLPTPTIYEINTNECDNCGKCIQYCDYDAINIANKSFEFVPENCIKCGNCIFVCRPLEEDAIVFTDPPFDILDYNQNDAEPEGCDPTQCQYECFVKCRFDAVTIGGRSDYENWALNSTFVKGDKAAINEDKCNKCGDCVVFCPLDAIIPEAVSRDLKKCDNCGLCYQICEVNVEIWIENGVQPNSEVQIDESKFAIRQYKPETDFDPEIDPDKCVSCGRCYPACSARLSRTDNNQPNKDRQPAIERELFYAQINKDKCTKCGKCFQACDYDAINEV